MFRAREYVRMIYIRHRTRVLAKFNLTHLRGLIFEDVVAVPVVVHDSIVHAHQLRLLIAVSHDLLACLLQGIVKAVNRTFIDFCQ